MADYDVIISGLGPAGATLSALLARDGLKVGVFEIHPTIFDKPRAIVLDHEALRTFQFCRINPDFYQGINPHPGTDFVGADGGLIKLFDPAPPPFPLGWAPTVTFVQPELEAELNKVLLDSPFVDVQRQWKVTGFTDEGNQVRVSVQSERDGTGREVTGRWLVGCDGANSPVRVQSGMQLVDAQFDEWWVVVDAWLLRDANLRKKTTQYCRPSRPGTLVIGPKHLRRWEIKLLPGEDPASFQNPEEVKRVLASFVDVEAVDIWRSAVYRFNARVAGQWRSGNVFIAGDAAHQTPPFLGQGLCAGVRDAANLAWKLVQVAKYGADETLLDSYEDERAPHVTTIINHAKEFGLIIGELDEAKAAARDNVLRAALEAGTAKTVRQDFIPNLISGVLDEASAPVAGTLFPQPLVRTAGGREALLEDLLSPHFLLAAADAEALSWLQGDIAACWAALGGTSALLRKENGAVPSMPEAIVLEDEAGALAEWLRARGARAVIARPDRYVYGIAADAPSLRRLVAGLAARLRGEVPATAADAVPA